MSVILHHAKLEDLLPTLAAGSIDACITDTPYHLTANKKGGSGAASVNLNSPAGRARIGAGTGFMGMGWDGGDVAFRVATWREVFRVLKPGAYLLAFGGTRTHHRMVCAIEDAGFEIRDEIDWLFGSGFPKSLNLEGEWDGWGTALKPAKEPICVARKPLIGTVAENVAAHRTGAINIDGCRVGDEIRTYNGSGPHLNKLANHGKGDTGIGLMDGRGRDMEFTVAGRWPANVIHDGSEEVLAAFPESGGQQGDLNGQSEKRISYGIFGEMPAPLVALARIETETSAARFFYCAKTSKEDREDGCAALPRQVADTQHKIPRSELDDPRRAGTVPRKNFHPTVKPTALMRYLCRLVTPPGGTVLDPFMGSGSTGRGAVLEGFHFVGVEMTTEYMPIARARITAAEQLKVIEDAERAAATVQQELPL